MKTPLYGAITGTLLVALLAGCARLPKDDGFAVLFDGATLDGWKVLPEGSAAWTVQDEALACGRDQRGILFTERRYRDFVLQCEVRLEEGASGAVLLRVPQATDLLDTSLVLRLRDDTVDWGSEPAAQYATGSLVGVAQARTGKSRPPGEWNQLEITCSGRSVRVRMNGWRILDADLNRVSDRQVLSARPGILRDRGYVGLVAEGRGYAVRQIRIRELSTPFVLNVAPEGFEALFNGRDLQGWQGLVADPIKRGELPEGELKVLRVKAEHLKQKNWSVADNALAYVGDGFDNLVSARPFRDFELTVEWKIDEKSDSGIYLRGCPQVQIWDEPVGSGGLYNNQKHPNTPSHRADRYRGSWNHFRILLLGDRVTVLLNDQVVVQDVLMENYWNREAPLFAVGPIELQAHQTPVWFRNIYVRDLSLPQPVAQ